MSGEDDLRARLTAFVESKRGTGSVIFGGGRTDALIHVAELDWLLATPAEPARESDGVGLTDAEWSDVLATLPENPETALGWELSLVRRTVERIIAARVAEAGARALLDFAELSTIAPRFWSKVRVSSPTACWMWLGATTGIGHGSFKSPAGNIASRYAWASANGRLPEPDEVVRHRCDNPPCVNPAHLQIGTQAENVADMVWRERAAWSGPECRNGHPRTPENLKLRANGDRRCLPCDQESRQKLRAENGPVACPELECDSTVTRWNLTRHLRKVHGMTSDEARDRARGLR